MWGSRKPGGGGGGGNPRGLIPRRPGPGSARGRGSPRPGPRPGSTHTARGRGDSLLFRVLMCFCPLRSLQCGCPALTKESAPGAARIASTGGSATAARSAAAAASASTGGVAAIARSAACGLMNPRAWRTSSATLVACVKYASVCVSPGGRNSHGRRPARGRPGVGPH